MTEEARDDYAKRLLREGDARIEFLEEVLRHDPDNIPVMTELGWLYDDHRHDSFAAIDLLTKAATLDPDSPEAFYWLAKVYYHSYYDPDLCRKALEDALRCDPEHVPSLSLLASCCVNAGDPDQAIGLLQKAMKLEPSWIMLLHEADRAYTMQGDLKEALVYARRAFILGKAFIKLSTQDSYSYYEQVITGRWLDKQSLASLRRQAARKV